MKNNKATKSQQFEEKVRNAVDFLYETTKDGNYNEGFARMKSRIICLCGSVLRTNGTIENNGNQTHPQYQWASDEKPSCKMYNEVLDEIRKINAGKKRNAKKAKEEKETLVDLGFLPEPTLPKQLAGLQDLSSYTDQQLWDELKNRNWTITNNQLTRTVVSYLN